MPFRRLGPFCAAIAVLAWLGCGDEAANVAPQPEASSPCGEETTPDGDNCVPNLPRCWAPTWVPPKPSAALCTEMQVTEEKSKCWGVDYDPDCVVFRRDPANVACLECLFSTDDEAVYGAILLLPNRSLPNVAGCMALIDGDRGSTGCASKYQAYTQCVATACRSCSYASYESCADVAAQGVCASYLQAAGCRLKPLYSACRDYATFDEFFFAMARVFCEAQADGGDADSDR